MAVATFMESSLVTWLRTFSAGEAVEFNDLIDAVYLHDVFIQIDERGQESNINRMAKDSNAKIQNWNTLIKDILAFYQDVLQQMVVLELPDISSIVKEPTKDASLKDLQRVLLLLLGCAIQSHGKESFIQNITRLDIHTQQAIMEYIKQITDGHSVVVNADAIADLGTLSRDKELCVTIKSLVRERDKYSQRITKLTQERDYHKVEADTKRGPLTPPASLEKRHMMRELTKFKTQANSLSEEVEEKARQLGDMKEELSSLKQERLRLKQENMMLTKDAKSARSYRDEVDNLKEQAMKAEKLEREISKYKEKLNELDFFKSRVEELREDNSLLGEAKAKAEDQTLTTSKRLESLLGDLDQLQLKVEEGNQEKEQLNKKLQELMEENAALEMEKTSLREGGMRRFQSTSRFLTCSQISLPGLAGANSNPISEELNDTMLTKASRLEMENEELMRELEESQGKLMDTERKLQQTLSTSEMAYKHKSDQLQLETSAIRHKLSQELSNEYRVKFEEKMKHQEEQVKRLLRDHQETLMSLKIREKELIQRLGEMERKEKQQLNRQESAEQKDLVLKEEIAELQKVADVAKSERVEAKKDLELSQKKAMQAHKFAENMQKERDSANQMLTHVQMTAKTQIDDLQSTLKQLQKANEQLQENYNQLSNQNGGYDSGIDETRHSPNSKSNGTTIPSPQVSRSPKLSSRPQSMFVNPQDVMHQGFKTPQSSKSRGPIHSSSPNKPMPQQFNRHNPLRITITPMKHPQNFNREHRLRQSMPDKKFVYRPPERRSQHTPKETFSRNFSMQETPVSSAVQTPSQSGHTTPTGSIGSDTVPIACSRNTSHNSDINDCSTPLSSRNAPDFNLDESISSINSTSTANGDTRDEKINRILRTLKITSTETITTKLKSFTKSEKTKVFIDKIIELQDKNQSLSQETSDLRKKLGSLRFSEDRVDRLEQKILELEAENQKLRKILEMYNYNGNPNDSRLYHYYSNV